MAYSIPEYPFKHSGPAIVCGSGPTLFDDFTTARKALPGAHVFAVNEAIRAVRTKHFVTLHTEKIEWFLALAKEAWPGLDTIAHLPITDKMPRGEGIYCWDKIATAATSSWAAVKLAKLLGHNEVIMCGCPLNGGDGYAFPTDGGKPGEPRFGFSERSGVRVHKGAFMDALKNGEGENVYSMSGYTREKLGAPKWL